MTRNLIDAHMFSGPVAERSIEFLIATVNGVARAAAIEAGEILVDSAIEWYRKPNKFSSDDQKRYIALVAAYYRSFGRVESTPEFWQLTLDNRPTFSLDYKKEILKIQSYIDNLIGKKSGMYLARAEILALIMRFLHSLDNRSWVYSHIDAGAIRNDGIETMFVIEMVTWLRCVLPELEKNQDRIIPDDGEASVHAQLSIHKVLQQRITYLDGVLSSVTRNHKSVLGVHADSRRANFKDLVYRLREQFANYISFLEQQASIVRFNGLIKTMGDSISELSFLSLNTLHLLIDGVNQPYLIVPQFLLPYKSDVRVMRLKEKKLGQWIERTLLLAGIKGGSFTPLEKLTLKSINSHLEGECPTDENCILEESLLNPLSGGWGHHEFITESHQSEEEKTRIASLYLQQIRGMHRSVLVFYYVQQNILRAATIASVYGEIWIYGDTIGKVVLEELLRIIEDITNDFEKQFNSFWQDYFANFEKYSRDAKKDDATNKTYHWLKECICSKYKQRIDIEIKEIKSHVSAIRTHASQLPEIKKETKRIQRELYEDILDFMIFKDRGESENFAIVKKALDDLNRDSGLVPNVKIVNTLTSKSSLRRKTYKIITGQSSKTNSKQDKEKPISPVIPVNPEPILVPIPGIIHKVDGDGNCFFRAIAFELNRQSDFEEYTHEKIRQVGVDYIANNLELFLEHFSEDEPIDEYISEMRKDKSWASGVIIEAVALAFNIHLYILDISRDSDGVKTCPFHTNEAKEEERRNYTVGLVRQELHYDALELPISRPEPRTRLRLEHRSEPMPRLRPELRLLETNISYRKSMLSVFESVSLLLGARVILDEALSRKRREPLLKEPKKFHTEFQEHLYRSFLYRNRSMKTNYLHITGVVYGLWMENVERIVRLYNNVNAVFLILYPHDRISISKFEMDMIDEYLRKRINKEFMTHRFFDFVISDFQSPFEVKKSTDMISIDIDTKKITVVRDDILKEAQNLVQSLPMVIEEKERVTHEKEKAIHEKEKAIHEKEKAIHEKEKAIHEKKDIKQSLDIARDNIVKLKKAISMKDEEIAALRKQLSELGAEPEPPRPRSPGMF